MVFSDRNGGIVKTQGGQGLQAAARPAAKSAFRTLTADSTAFAFSSGRFSTGQRQAFKVTP
jgi:hypothetical protein